MKPETLEKAILLRESIADNTQSIEAWKQVEFAPTESVGIFSRRSFTVPFTVPRPGLTKEMVAAMTAQAVGNLIAEGKELQRQFDAL